MVETKAQYIAANGQGIQDWLLARIDALSAAAARFPRLVNALFRNRGARWAMERTLGVAQGRKLPTLNRRPVLHSSLQRKHHRLQREAGEKVLLFVDTYANYYDRQLAEAAVAVLEHNGVSVYIPGSQGESGMPMIAQGMLEPARRIAERNVVLLAEAVRQGYSIVTIEPSAALAITREYQQLLGDDSDAKIVADSTLEICHYLWRRHQRGALELNFKPLSIKCGYHAPCHVKALEVGSPSVNLLSLIPGLQIQTLEKGCSGIAGLYGFKRRSYRSSLRAGLPLLTEMRTGRFQIGVTECSTCRIQMEQGSAKPTIHPLKLLALSYGLKPELSELLNRANEELTVR
jgi:Fe-S oxidoreductase